MQVSSRSTYSRSNLYVFYKKPANYAAWGIAALLHVLFRAAFILYGKSNKISQKSSERCAASPHRLGWARPVMQRNPLALANQAFDLVVIGGRIFGICAAWTRSRAAWPSADRAS